MPRHFGLRRPRHESTGWGQSIGIATLLMLAGVCGFFAATWAITFAYSVF